MKRPWAAHVNDTPLRGVVIYRMQAIHCRFLRCLSFLVALALTLSQKERREY